MEIEQEPQTLVLHEQGVEETGLLRKISGKSKNNGVLDADEVGNDSVSSSSSSSRSELVNDCEIGYQEDDENSFANGSHDVEKAAEKEENGSLLNHSVFLDNDKGSASNGKAHEVIVRSVDETDIVGEELAGTKKYVNQGYQGSEIEPQNVTTKEEENGSNLHSESFGKFQQEEITNNGPTLKDYINEIEEVGEETTPTEYDVETVIKKQNTHDLYCPNCHSCITRKVILRRKRRVKHPRNKPRREEVDKVPVSDLANGASKPSDMQPNLDDSPARPSNTQSPLPGQNANDEYKEKVVFRCLSCFSYFIPTGNGFKLFRCFGDDSEKYSLINPQETHEPSKNWFISMFASGRKKAEISEEPKNKPDMATGNEELDQKNDLGQSLGSSSLDQSFSPWKATVTGSQNAQKSAISSSTDTVSNGATDQSESTTGKISADKLPVENGSTPSLPTIILPATSTSNGNGNSQTQNIGIASILPSEKENAVVNNAKANLKDKSDNVIEKPNTGDHAITIEQSLQEANAQAAQVVPAEAESLLEGRIQRDTNQWDIIKSIVYGGLMESITSVGVVSSAVGADIAALKAFALGIANLVGGLFVIIHNLVELKKGRYSADATRLSDREGDRYQELLGRRQNFPLHVTVAILSYLIFGSLPPLIYGLSFRQSGDRDLKLAAVAGASLLCIAILAFAKAHVRRPPKSYFKTISQFVLIGVSAAGVSYLAGRLIDRLMEKLGWLDSDPNLSVSYPGATAANSGWAYY